MNIGRIVTIATVTKIKKLKLHLLWDDPCTQKSQQLDWIFYE